MFDSPNGRIAMILFAVYLVLYSGFMLINVFAPALMDKTPLAGVNLAIWYGFLLIAAAIFLAFLYGALCRPNEEDPNRTKGGQQ
ncbi:DUF485 domain-containing protein [Rubinisphaera margarita]|uniref:DUF485 domain-containing protein n=1 Tax=Rubinisphaera margarita TaxID=2909586 RepID=UPI001EE8770F|nr:DUF485 domain-containing protein [Rubinisphaera margarita]MCG6156015.1 DUF485 domain-containing protein [Rubinisphaera margarita]